MTLTGMHVRDHYVEYKAKVGGRDPNVDYHIDHWKIRFKAFLLLDDVGPEQAPFVYVVGSHREEPWRKRQDWRYQSREDEGAIVNPEQVERIRRKYGFEERVVTGTAGDLILANTRGIHRGTVLEQGTRLHLVTLFGMNGPPEYACRAEQAAVSDADASPGSAAWVAPRHDDPLAISRSAACAGSPPRTRTRRSP